MILSKIYLSSFRNHNYAEFEFDPGVNLITGPNGSGKTAVLEAVHYLSLGRSYRARYDREVVNWNGESFSTRGEFDDSNVDSIALEYQLKRSDGSKKQVLVDDSPLAKLSRLQGLFPTVLYYPTLINLPVGSPENRRKFMNRLLGQIDHEYIDFLNSYRKALDQRNSLLKQPSPDELLLEQYESRMAESSREIRATREGLADQLNELFCQEGSEIGSDLLSRLKLEYSCDLGEDEDLAGMYELERQRAVERGYTTLGVHRDDWEIVDPRGRSLKEFVSRGELKLVLLALKFTEARYLAEHVGLTPAFLADDFVAELDESRQGTVLNRVRELDLQFICTGVGPLRAGKPDRIIDLGG